MKVCTVLGCSTSKEPIKLPLHSDSSRQTAHGRGSRMGAGRAAHPQRWGTVLPGPRREFFTQVKPWRCCPEKCWCPIPGGCRWALGSLSRWGTAHGMAFGTQ